LAVSNDKAREFYETEALRNGWSVRQLERQINSQFYERAALSKDKTKMLQRAESLPEEKNLTPAEVIKDPFILEFLNLKDEYSESDLEDALINHLADFLLELGDDMAFVGRQRRLRIDDQSVCFSNGRHRAKWLLHEGQLRIPVFMSKRSIDEARNIGLVSKIITGDQTIRIPAFDYIDVPSKHDR